MAFAYEDSDKQDIEDRIAPVGKVNIESSGNQVKPAETQAPASKTPTADPGQATYEKYCVVCHQNGLAGAPKFRNTSDWEPRLKGKQIQDLVKIATQGLNAMPPKGTCMECTDNDLKSAIEYMVPKHD